MEKVVIAVCVLMTVISALPPRHIKGIQIKNNGQEGLWIEMTNENSFNLPAGQMASVILEDSWSGKIFARSEECQYKKCNSPYTVAELTFGGDAKDDRYRVSVIDGYNKPIKIQPSGPNNFCKVSSCKINLKLNCPPTHQIKGEDTDDTVACHALPDVFQSLCPHAATSDTDKDMFSCKTSNTYFVSIG
ncbi:unnamed protein product [Diabrotica balteata]|uniref:Uncharacterized protein n=1 Tax=Diabrotica balteata TaxID=107213 RepID=A0A9N9T4P8_DIABA|nr:unnamed protein product [Diabrotica balteata]